MLTIRKLLSADYEDFYAMRIKMLESSTENYTAGLSDWKNASKEQIISYLHESEGPSDNFVLGAFSERLVGMVGFRRETREALRHKGSTWGLFEDPNFKHLNIEAALLKQVIEIVKGYPDFEYIRTVQNATNLSKLELFSRLGFTEYGREERSMRVGDQYFDQVYLKRVI
ncbi:MAG: GNAT family N-acetyltransferase [Bdellovibrionota bacterium]